MAGDRAMHRRSRGREIALQALYQVEQNPEISDAEIDRFIAKRVREQWLRDESLKLLRSHRSELSPLDAAALLDRKLANLRVGKLALEELETPFGKLLQELCRSIDLHQFTRRLYEGVRANLPQLDEAIGETAENWSVDRMAAIDRNIIRLGAYEILFVPEVPNRVAINEALEIAKRYSTAQSSRFVNGILDRLRGKVETEPAQKPADGE